MVLVSDTLVLNFKKECMFLLGSIADSSLRNLLFMAWLSWIGFAVWNAFIC